MTDGPRAVLCSRCRQLIGGATKICPHCGARTSGLRGATSSVVPLLRAIDPVQLTIGFSVLLYLGCLAFNPSAVFQDRADLLSLGSPDSRALLLLGATGGASWLCDQHWTLLTANFLHGSVLHILFNMLWLKSLGRLSCQLFGPARFFILFMLTGMGGFAFSVWGDPFFFALVGSPFEPIPMPTIGASASIFGLMGVLVGHGRREGGRYGDQITRQLLTWAIALFLLGFVMQGINNMAHLGGFISGYLLSFTLPLRGQRAPEQPVVALALALAALTVVGIIMSFLSWSPYVFEGQIPDCLYL